MLAALTLKSQHCPPRFGCFLWERELTPDWICRQQSGPKRLSGAAAMAVAAAQKRAAVSAPAEVSANGTPEPHGPAASAPLQQPLHGSGLGADVAGRVDRRAHSEAERVSPDTDAASIVGEANSLRANSDNIGSLDKSGCALLPAVRRPLDPHRLREVSGPYSMMTGVVCSMNYCWWAGPTPSAFPVRLMTQRVTFEGQELWPEQFILVQVTECRGCNKVVAGNAGT